MTKKLTKQQIEEIKKSDESINNLAKKYNVTNRTIYYHKDEEIKNKTLEYNRKRYNNLTSEQKKHILSKKRDFQRKYHRERYHNDENFREKQKERSKKFKERNNENKR